MSGGRWKVLWQLEDKVAPWILGTILLVAPALSEPPLESSPVPPGCRVVNEAQGTVAPAAGANSLRERLLARKIRLIGVRHGQSECNRQAELNKARILCGQVETPLSQLGLQQAKQGASEILSLLGEARSHLVVYASPLQRARDTARATVDLLKDPVEIHLDDRLLEYGFGDCELMSVPQACQLYPDFMKRWDPTEGSGTDFLHRFPGGESRADVWLRVQEFLEELAEHHQGETVLVFCHMRTLAAMQEALGLMPLENGVLREVTSGLKNAVPITLVNPTLSPQFSGGGLGIPTGRPSGVAGDSPSD